MKMEKKISTIDTTLAAGSKVNAKDNDGDTALIWAADNGREAVAKLLKNGGGK